MVVEPAYQKIVKKIFVWCDCLIGKTLVVGTGFFGEKLMRLLSASNIEVEGTLIEERDGFTKLDITDKESVSTVFDNAFPELVVLTAAVSNVDYCEQHKEEAFKINVEGAKNIVEACRQFNSKLVFLSTDYVFDGKRGNYIETDKPNPIQYYGTTKLLAEKEVLKLENALVMRVSSLYGFNSLSDKPCFPLFVVNQLKEGKEVNASMQITNPTLIDDAALALQQLVEMNAAGIFHAVGANALSRFDAAMQVAETFELDESLIKKASDLHFAAARPENSSLNIKKLNSVGIEMTDFSHGLQKMKQQMEES